MTERISGRRTRPASAGGLSLLTGIVLASSLLTGCGGSEAKDSAKPAGPGAAAVASDPAGLDRSEPTAISIPKLGVSAPMMLLGMQKDGRVEEPPLSKPNLAGWYKEGPTPGEIGPSVILGHVDANKKPAVFYRLKELAKGDKIEVKRKDGKTAVFVVDRIESVPKAKFPGEKIYAENLGYAALRLITCGGAFDSKTGHYVDNVIAYARLSA